MFSAAHSFRITFNASLSYQDYLFILKDLSKNRMFWFFLCVCSTKVQELTALSRTELSMQNGTIWKSIEVMLKKAWVLFLGTD